jgi:cell division protein FtsX
MITQVFIASSALFGIFVLFLVLSKTLNNIINQFVKLQYFLQKEYDLKKERLAIAQLLEEEQDATKKNAVSEAQAQAGGESPPTGPAVIKKPSAPKK